MFIKGSQTIDTIITIHLYAYNHVKKRIVIYNL